MPVVSAGHAKATRFKINHICVGMMKASIQNLGNGIIALSFPVKTADTTARVLSRLVGLSADKANHLLSTDASVLGHCKSVARTLMNTMPRKGQVTIRLGFAQLAGASEGLFDAAEVMSGKMNPNALGACPDMLRSMGDHLFSSYLEARKLSHANRL